MSLVHEQTTKGVTLGAERMAQAAEPVGLRRKYSQIQQRVTKVFPVVSQLGDMVLKAQSGLTESHSAIQRGTAEYLEVTGWFDDGNRSNLLHESYRKNSERCQ